MPTSTPTTDWVSRWSVVSGGFQKATLAYQRAVAPPDGDLVGDSLGQGSGHPDTARVGEPHAAAAVVPDTVYARGGQEGAEALRFFLRKTGRRALISFLSQRERALR